MMLATLALALLQLQIFIRSLALPENTGKEQEKSRYARTRAHGAC
jgi:hypothetical protein